jgi:hypothetical protein
VLTTGASSRRPTAGSRSPGIRRRSTSGRTRSSTSWLADLFAPSRRDQPVDALHDAGEDPATVPRRRAAPDELHRCDDRLAKYRAKLEAGADPAVVTGWIAEVTAQRTRWEIEMNRARGRTRLTKDQIATIVGQMAGLTAILRQANPRDQAEVYAQPGLRLTYQNEKRLIIAEAGPEPAWSYLGVRGPILITTT